jgi:hypothetical protein
MGMLKDVGILLIVLLPLVSCHGMGKKASHAAGAASQEQKSSADSKGKKESAASKESKEGSASKEQKTEQSTQANSAQDAQKAQAAICAERLKDEDSILLKKYEMNGKIMTVEVRPVFNIVDTSTKEAFIVNLVCVGTQGRMDKSLPQITFLDGTTHQNVATWSPETGLKSNH